jgi:hypothetical protein
MRTGALTAALSYILGGVFVVKQLRLRAMKTEVLEVFDRGVHAPLTKSTSIRGLSRSLDKLEDLTVKCLNAWVVLLAIVAALVSGYGDKFYLWWAGH